MPLSTRPSYQISRITCSCGNSFETRATKPEINVEICSACHPFYTGQQKLVDNAGRIERFNRKLSKQNRKTIN